MHRGRLILLLFVVLTAGTCLAQAASVGQSAPGFTLSDSRKSSHTLSRYKGKVVLINFWASWCAPCQTELPLLNDLARRYGDRLQVLAVNVDENPAEGRKALERLKLQTPALRVLWDSRKKVVSAYNVPTMPTSYVLDRHGKIRFIHEGFRPSDKQAWEQEVQELLR